MADRRAAERRATQEWASEPTPAARPPRPRRRRAPLVLAGLLAFLLGLGAVLWATGAGEYGVWWLTNRAEPTLGLSAPPEARRGAVPIDVRLEPRGRARIVEVQVDGRPLPTEGQLVVDTATLPDGPHQVTVIAEDFSWRKNRTTAVATVTSDNTPPQIVVDSQPQQVTQGRTWVLRIQANEPATVNAKLGDRQLDVQPGNGFAWVVLGFGRDTPPATLPLVVDASDSAGNRGEQRQSLQVVAGEFPLDRVEVPASLAPLLAPEIRAAEDQRLTPLYRQVTRPRLWEGRFVFPGRGPVVTQFGEQRTYNGGPIVPQHNGADMALPGGQPLLAPARGKVVFIDQLPLRGNVVVLDHGLGAFTTYAHLATVDVQIGQTVERSQPFATVGSTGLSQGPHLHWELWVGGENVDPLEWTERDLP